MSVGERREKLVDAAFTVMKRDGIAAASTRAICAEAEMPHGAFHYCFRSKSELYAALLGRGINIGLEDAWPSVSAANSITDNIRTLLHAYWSAMEADPDGQLVLFDLGSFALRDPELHELSRWEHQASMRQVAGHIERLADETGIRFLREDRILGEIVLATMNGVAWSWLSHRDNALARLAVDELSALLASLAEPASG